MNMTGQAFFVDRPRVLADLTDNHNLSQAHRYEIAAKITLGAEDYENFICDMLVERQFIEDNCELCSPGDPWKCLLVRKRGKSDGVLVMPKNQCFVGQAAYYPGE